jgi:hypothetical protein
MGAPKPLAQLSLEQAVQQRERARDLAAHLESELFATRERAAAAVRVAGERENDAYAKAAALAEALNEGRRAVMGGGPPNLDHPWLDRAEQALASDAGARLLARLRAAEAVCQEVETFIALGNYIPEEVEAALAAYDRASRDGQDTPPAASPEPPATLPGLEDAVDALGRLQVDQEAGQG